MPTAPFDFTNEPINASYPRVMQWSGSDDVVRDGFGDPLPVIQVPVSYSNAGFGQLGTVQQALDFLLYVSPSIIGFTNNRTLQETGSIVSSVHLSWSYNKTMVSATLTGTGSINPAQTTFDFSGLTLTTPTTYILTVSDGTNSTNSNTTVDFLNKFHEGTSPSASLSTADIIGLSDSYFATNRFFSDTFNGNGQYEYVCYPARFGLATFTINGLLNTAWTLSVQPFTNPSGFTEDYNVYRTNTIQFGTNISLVIT